MPSSPPVAVTVTASSSISYIMQVKKRKMIFENRQVKECWLTKVKIVLLEQTWFHEEHYFIFFFFSYFAVSTATRFSFFFFCFFPVPVTVPSNKILSV